MRSILISFLLLRLDFIQITDFRQQEMERLMQAVMVVEVGWTHAIRLQDIPIPKPGNNQVQRIYLHVKIYIIRIRIIFSPRKRYC